MAKLSLAKANKIIREALRKGHEQSMKPLTVVVLDAGGHMVAMQREDNSSVLRPQVAQGKAFGCIAVGMGARWLNAQAETRPHFLEGLSNLSGGKIMPVPGGVLIKTKTGEIVGAVGITGDTSDNDEMAAIAGVEAAQYVADTGA
ncbi:MAG: heme-binding protein [Pseudomonadota bacterium]